MVSYRNHAFAQHFDCLALLIAPVLYEGGSWLGSNGETRRSGRYVAFSSHRDAREACCAWQRKN